MLIKTLGILDFLGGLILIFGIKFMPPFVLIFFGVVF